MLNYEKLTIEFNQKAIKPDEFNVDIKLLRRAVTTNL